ncbi:MAG: glycoside hydrolase family 6 protein [Acidothermaceae bacterium]
MGTRPRSLVFAAASAAAAVSVGISGTALAAPGQASVSNAPAHSLTQDARLYTPPPDKGAIEQVKSLLRNHDLSDALSIAQMASTPQAVWFTSGGPLDVQKQVHETVVRASRVRDVPVLVAYNVPGRDCSQYSSGGAGSDPAYQAWIDGFVKGLGNSRAIVIVEPDGLANLPSDCPAAYPGQDVAALTAGRIADIKYAAESIENNDRNSLVYLDAGHSAWHSVADISTRLEQAGVSDVQGFSLNTSNYQYTANLDFYGTWISDCLTYTEKVVPGDYGSCGDMYWSGGPANNWTGVALSPYGVWSETASDPTLNTIGIDSRYASILGTTTPTAHFVVDTSRNGNGPNNMSAYSAAPYNQPANVVSSLAGGNWCNPPGAGLGLLPTTHTGVPLVDAYLWVKTPGQSDGQCNIAGGARAWDYTQYNPWNWDTTQQQNNDPLWGITDPAAGAWFNQQALQLAQLAKLH